MLTIKMRRTPDSSNMDAYGYLQAASMLFVRFKDGRMYGYSGVPTTLARDLRAASSKGVFFNKYIKNVHGAFEIKASREFEFVDDDSQVEIAVMQPLDDLPADPRWAW